MKKTTLFVILLIAVLGCQEDKSLEKQNTQDLKEDVLSESKESNSGRTKTSSQIFTDWSGQVQVIVMEQEFGLGHAPSGSITLTSDYVLIGWGCIHNLH